MVKQVELATMAQFREAKEKIKEEGVKPTHVVISSNFKEKKRVV